MNANHSTNTRSTATAAIAVFLSMAISACGPDEVVERAEVARPVKLFTLGLTGDTASLEIPGSVYATQSAELAFEVAGRMSERQIEEGQVVAPGQVVAKLDPRDYQARRDRAQATRDTTKADYDRYAKAYEANAVTQQDLSRAKGHYDVSEADLAVAQKALDDTELRAPFAGRIAKRVVDDFANVQAKQTVMVLQDESSLELRVNVSERDWVMGNGGLSRDQVTERIKPRVRVTSLGKRLFPGYLKEMSNSADPVTRTFEVTFGFASPEDVNVSPGMTGSVIIDKNRINASETAGLSIPLDLVVADANGNSFVWVVDPMSMRANKRPVELGELFGANTHIVSGLSLGERIVASGVNSITPNMLVREIESN